MYVKIGKCGDKKVVRRDGREDKIELEMKLIVFKVSYFV